METVARFYRCGECGVTTTEFDGLKAHMLSAHLPYGSDLVELPDAGEQEQTNSQCSDVSSSQIEIKDPPDYTSSQKAITDDENEVDLNFKVKIPSYEMPMFPKHIKPALFFTCSYCEFRHQSFKKVSVHISSCHPKKLDSKLRSRDPSTCSKDASIVDNTAYLSSRKAMKSSKNLLYKNRLGDKRSNMRKSEKTFSCNLCHMKCDKEQILEIHKRCHKNGKLRCCFCDKSAPSVKAWYGLYIHMVNRHPEQVPAPIHCEICQKGFVKEWDLRKHMACHSDSKPYRCDSCSDSFKFKINLDHHGILRHGLGTEEQRQKLIRRMRARPAPSLRDDLPWLFCPNCTYKTKAKSKLLVHSKIHAGIKDIHCQYCDYKTGDSSSLRRHMWRHREHKPYSCKFCDFNCIQRAQLQAHYKNKHSVLPSESKDLIRHVNGPRQYIGLDTDAYSPLESTPMSNSTTSSHNSITEPQAITLQDVSADLGLLTEAAEGLLAASQIELHAT